MRILGKGKVYLEEGEVVPVFCSCSNIYIPREQSVKSVCPQCFKVNFHADQRVVREMRH